VTSKPRVTRFGALSQKTRKQIRGCRLDLLGGSLYRFPGVGQDKNAKKLKKFLMVAARKRQHFVEPLSTTALGLTCRLGSNCLSCAVQRSAKLGLVPGECRLALLAPVPAQLAEIAIAHPELHCLSIRSLLGNAGRPSQRTHLHQMNGRKYKC